MAGKSLAKERGNCEEPPIMDLMQVDMRVREENIARTESYNTSRRSLRIWPVRGTTDEEVRRSAISFIRDKLLVDESDLTTDQICRVRRSKPPRKARVRFEALVTFSDKYGRDLVSSHGRNLADYVDSTGLPTAGIRMDYPAYLGVAFRSLDWYGKQMRDRHGKGTRRNIKFDDEEEGLYIDVCLPQQDYWHRITPEEARKYKIKVDQERTSMSRKSLEGPTNNNEPTHFIGQHRRPLGVNEGSQRAESNDGYVSPEKRR